MLGLFLPAVQHLPPAVMTTRLQILPRFPRAESSPVEKSYDSDPVTGCLAREPRSTQINASLLSLPPALPKSTLGHGRYQLWEEWRPHGTCLPWVRSTHDLCSMGAPSPTTLSTV